MKNRQCQLIGKKLLRGETVTRGQTMAWGISAAHSRIRNLSGWIEFEIDGENDMYGRLPLIGYYIYNLNPKNTCAEYKLPAKYRRYLKSALKRRGLL